MIKKSFVATVLVATACMFAMPAQAQFGKGLGKTLGKVAKDAGKVATTMAGDMATEMGATKASEKIVQFMDNNNTIAAPNSEYTTRLAGIIDSNFADVEGKALSFAVYESPEANIIALNNGSIRIYSGMMDLLDDDEIKALLAMQAAHINSGNVRDNLLKAVAGDNAESAGAAQIEKMLSFSGDKLGSVINELLQIPYTESQNVKADVFAKNYLKAQGGDVDSYYSLLSKFGDLQYIDLEDEALDTEDEDVIKATAAAKFIKVNGLR